MPNPIYTIKLATCPNRDFNETTAPKGPVEFSGPLDAIKRFADEYRQGLGGGNWKRADIYHGRKKVARMSYNGRLWDTHGTPIEGIPKSKPTKLGSRQQLVLDRVAKGLEPYTPGPDYYKDKSVAFALLQSYVLSLLPHNHPDVIAGKLQWRVGPAAY